MEILCYTREPLNDAIYAKKLAYSMHLAYRKNKEDKFTPLHHNEGLLYAKATQNADGTLTAKCLCSPYIFEKKGGGFGIIATRTDADGKPDTSDGCVIYFESNDLVHFCEIGLVEIQSVMNLSYEQINLPKEVISKIEGCCPGNVITISEKAGEYLLNKLADPICEHNTESEHFHFPFAEKKADPFCMHYNGKYYFTATNEADGHRTLYIRCSNTLQGLSAAPEVLLLDTVTYPDIKGLLWAPEIHEIDGNLYIFHAATDSEFFREEAHVMKLRHGGDIMNRNDWSAPHLVVKKDGSPLCEAGKVISLDMTVLEYENEMYAMWSQRQFIPADQGAWLYIAKIDRKEPWKILTDPVCIAKPEYGWENNHTFVAEGPFAIWNNGQLMVTYSAAMVDTTYSVGMLKPIMGSNILDPKNWRKSNYPLLSSRSVPGEYGPGHNCYVTDENSNVWNFYHAKAGIDAPRCTGIRRVYFDVDGEPILNAVMPVDCRQ